MLELTDRQRREREFYEEYASRRRDEEVDFDPVLGKERRPWNPYWYVYEAAVNFFSSPEQKLLDFGCHTIEFIPQALVVAEPVVPTGFALCMTIS